MQGNPQARTVEYAEGKGMLEIGGRKLEVAPRIAFSYRGPKDGGLDTLYLNAWLTFNGKELGLAAPGTEGQLDVRIGMSGSTQTTKPPKHK